METVQSAGAIRPRLPMPCTLRAAGASSGAAPVSTSVFGSVALAPYCTQNGPVPLNRAIRASPGMAKFFGTPAVSRKAIRDVGGGQTAVGRPIASVSVIKEIIGKLSYKVSKKSRAAIRRRHVYGLSCNSLRETKALCQDIFPITGF